jgi:hypothetical protein
MLIYEPVTRRRRRRRQKWQIGLKRIRMRLRTIK